jgi:hypothetical protein
MGERVMLALLKIATVTTFTAISALYSAAPAQTRCEPTISKPCNSPSATSQPTANKPASTTTNTLSNTLREPVAPPREKTKLDPVPAIPDIKLDKDTSMGFGHGGIIGLERKF